MFLNFFSESFSTLSTSARQSLCIVMAWLHWSNRLADQSGEYQFFFVFESRCAKSISSNKMSTKKKCQKAPFPESSDSKSTDIQTCLEWPQGVWFLFYVHSYVSDYVCIHIYRIKHSYLHQQVCLIILNQHPHVWNISFTGLFLKLTVFLVVLFMSGCLIVHSLLVSITQ